MTSILEVKIACVTKDYLSIDDMVPFQGDLKTLTEKNYRKLKTEIVTTGFAFPIMIWKDLQGTNNIIGGTQRWRVLSQMRAVDNYFIPNIPVVFVDAASIEEARRRVLQDASQYGIIEVDELLPFVDLAGIDLAEIDSRFKLPDINIPKALEDGPPEDEPEKEKTCPHCGGRL